MRNQELINEIKAKLERQTSTIASNNVLLSELAAAIRENADDPAELKAIADQLEANTASIDEAIRANTPAASEPSTDVVP